MRKNFIYYYPLDDLIEMKEYGKGISIFEREILKQKKRILIQNKNAILFINK